MAEKDRIRTKQIHIKLSEDEYETLKSKSEKAELTVADVIRYLIVYGHIRPKKFDEKSQKVLEDLREYLGKRVYEINCIGNNINQIAWNTNGRLQTDLEQLAEAWNNLIELQEMFSEDVNMLEGLIQYADGSDS